MASYSRFYMAFEFCRTYVTDIVGVERPPGSGQLHPSLIELEKSNKFVLKNVFVFVVIFMTTTFTNAATTS